MFSALRVSLILASTGGLFAQLFPGLTLPPSGNNQRSFVSQHIGPVEVSIDYSSPAVHGPDGKDRRGEIWGKLVPYGMTNLGFGNGKPGPWRAGANENTVLATSNDVIIDGKRLPAGRYGVHMIAGPEEWTFVFSKDSTSWGSFWYDEAADALRVKAKPHKNDYREWLTYEFTARRPSEATVEMQWEDLAVPLTIKVNNIDDIYVTRLRQELEAVRGFHYKGYAAAAMYCVQVNTHLDQALEWAEAAVSMPGIGQANFETLSAKSQVLAKMGRQAEADTAMQAAIHHPTASPFDFHQYGRQLIAEKKYQEALAVFKLSAERNGDAWPVHVGLARGYSGVGDVKTALEHARKALEQAPDPLNRDSLQAMVKTLAAGQPINQ
jgi:tetratricopeptide (TPR) repeat protein